MGIRVKDFIKAIADKLKYLYPDYDIYTDKIGQYGYENCFYVSNISTSQKRQLKPKHMRTYSFDIIYFHEDNDKIEFYDWADTMLQNFRKLKVQEDLYFTNNPETKEVDSVFHCMFEIDFYVRDLVKEPKMDYLKQEGNVKDG